MHSHHSHSGQFCKHAKSSLADVLEQAHSLGFTHFHLSEHCPRPRAEELYPEEREAGMDVKALEDTFRAYVSEARRLQAVYAPRMQVLVGCETENVASPGSVAYLRRFLHGDDEPPPFVAAGVLDYMVGSVHHVCGTPIDFDADTFRSALEKCAHTQVGQLDAAPPAAYEQLMCLYLDLQYEVLDRLRPEVVGHMDLFRLFAPGAPWFPEAWAPASASHRKLLRNIRFAASYGALFEANSAAFRKGWAGETYPGRVFLGLIRAAHGRIALSDDSHGTHQVALNYARLREYLAAQGIDEVWCLERDPQRGAWPTERAARQALFQEEERRRQAREALEAPGTADCPTRFPRGSRAVRIGSEWRDARFWTALPSSRLTP